MSVRVAPPRLHGPFIDAPVTTGLAACLASLDAALYAAGHPQP